MDGLPNEGAGMEGRIAWLTTGASTAQAAASGTELTPPGWRRASAGEGQPHPGQHGEQGCGASARDQVCRAGGPAVVDPGQDVDGHHADQGDATGGVDAEEPSGCAQLRVRAC